MDDYISREAAVAAMTALRQEDIEAFGMVIPECFPSTSAIEALNKIPAADVVEVVRCGDCRYFHNGYDEKCCINHKGVVVTDENGFCHHAERRDDNGK